MSIPATGIHAAYRNHVRDVAALLKKRHQDHYLVGHVIATESAAHHATTDHQRLREELRCVAVLQPGAGFRMARPPGPPARASMQVCLTLSHQAIDNTGLQHYQVHRLVAAGRSAKRGRRALQGAARKLEVDSLF